MFAGFVLLRRSGCRVRVVTGGFRWREGRILGERGVDCGGFRSIRALRDLRLDSRGQFGSDFLDLLLAFVEAATVKGDGQCGDDAGDSGSDDGSRNSQLAPDDRGGRCRTGAGDELGGGDASLGYLKVFVNLVKS